MLCVSSTVGSSSGMHAPLAPQHMLGRIFGSDWTIANVAKLLRAKASEGNLRVGPMTGALWETNQNYLRTTSARHLPSGVTVTFRRDETRYHAELCFANLDHYLPWRDALAEEWLTALFLQDRPRVREVLAAASQSHSGRHYELTI